MGHLLLGFGDFIHPGPGCCCVYHTSTFNSWKDEESKTKWRVAMAALTRYGEAKWDFIACPDLELAYFFILFSKSCLASLYNLAVMTVFLLSIHV